ncbi:MAG: type II secretion system protein GspD [Planctomycetota bacterium]
MKHCFYTCVLLCVLCGALLAAESDAEENGESPEGLAPIPSHEATVQLGEKNAGQFTLNLKDVPLQDLLDMVSKRTGEKYLVKPDAKDTSVSAFLPNCNLEDALPVIFSVHDLTAEEVEDNIVVVSHAQEEEEGEPDLETEVVQLKYSDAEDVKKTLEPLLSARGEIMVVKKSGHTGWGFGSGQSEEGGGAFEARERKGKSARQEIRAQWLVVSDIQRKLEIITKVIDEIDVRPEQVAISARILEVSRDDLDDIGFDWGTGSKGIESSNITSTNPWGDNNLFRGNILGSQTAPDILSSDSDYSGTFPYDAGMNLLFSKIGGSEYEVLIHALEQNTDAEVLSEPKLLTLDGREAVFLVGTRFPILDTEVSGTETTQVTTSLDYYENIGIQLNVVPQIQDDGHVNMVIHPVVSERSETVNARGSEGQTLAEYPVIETRETELQVMTKSGETIVIAGLLKNVKRETTTGVPVLQHIPLLGALFRRDVETTEKVDLLIFLSANVIENPAEATEMQMRDLGAGEGRDEEIPQRRRGSEAE